MSWMVNKTKRSTGITAEEPPKRFAQFLAHYGSQVALPSGRHGREAISESGEQRSIAQKLPNSTPDIDPAIDDLAFLHSLRLFPLSRGHRDIRPPPCPPHISPPCGG